MNVLHIFILFCNNRNMTYPLGIFLSDYFLIYHGFQFRHMGYYPYKAVICR